MKKYYIDYAISGRMIVEANSAEEARENARTPYEDADGVYIEYDTFDVVNSVIEVK
jgi:hypothetical protein